MLFNFNLKKIIAFSLKQHERQENSAMDFAGLSDGGYGNWTSRSSINAELFDQMKRQTETRSSYNYEIKLYT